MLGRQALHRRVLKHRATRAPAGARPMPGRRSTAVLRDVLDQAGVLHGKTPFQERGTQAGERRVPSDTTAWRAWRSSTSRAFAVSVDDALDEGAVAGKIYHARPRPWSRSFGTSWRERSDTSAESGIATQRDGEISGTGAHTSPMNSSGISTASATPVSEMIVNLFARSPERRLQGPNRPPRCSARCFDDDDGVVHHEGRWRWS